MLRRAKGSPRVIVDLAPARGELAASLDGARRAPLEHLEAISVGILVLAKHWAEIFVKGRPVVWRK